MIILHHAEVSGCSIQNIHSWNLNNGWSGCGYHYFIRKDGTIYKVRPDNAIGAHCLSYNGVSIGVCMEGRFNVEQMGYDDYELELKYSAKGRKAKYLEEWNIIKTDEQLFRIYRVEKISKEIKIIKVWAKHIFYDLLYYSSILY